MAQITQTQDNLAKAQADYDKWNSQIPDLTASVNTLNLNVTQILALIAKANNTVNAIGKAIADARITSGYLAGNYTANQRSFDTAYSSYSALLNSRAALVTKANQFNSTIIDLQKKLAATTQSCAPTQVLIDTETTKQTNLKNSLISIQSSLATAQQDVAKRQAIVDDLAKQLAAAQAALTAAQTNQQSIQQSLTDTQNQIQQSTNVVSSLIVKCGVQAVQDDIAANQAQLNTIINTQIAPLDAQIIPLYNTLIKLQSTNGAIYAQYTNLQQQINNATALMNQYAAQIPNLQKTLEDYKMRVNAAVLKLNQAQSNAAAAQLRITKETNSLATLSSLLNAARNENQAAQNAYNILVSTYANALPFPSTTNPTIVNQTTYPTQIDLENFLIQEYAAAIGGVSGVNGSFLYPFFTPNPIGGNNNVINGNVNNTYIIYAGSVLTSIIPGGMSSMTSTSGVGFTGPITLIFGFNLQLSTGAFISGRIMSGMITSGALSNGVVLTQNGTVTGVNATGKFVFGRINNMTNIFEQLGEVTYGTISNGTLGSDGKYFVYTGTGCQGAPWANSLNSGKGKITSYDPASNTLILNNNGDTVCAYLTPCSVNVANVMSYNPAVGDIVYFNGNWDPTSRCYSVTSITCISPKQ